MSVSELDQYRQQFEQIKTQAKELTEGLDEARFNWRPAPKEWSIEECLAHLIQVGNWEIKVVETAIDSAKARGVTGAGPFRYGPIERFLLRETEPPVKHKARAPKRFRPLHGQPVTGILPSFLHLQSQFVLLIGRAEGLNLARIKVPTPLPLLRLSLGMTFAQTAAHERRHLEQARRVHEKLAR
jgi:hypothetical protein